MMPSIKKHLSMPQFLSFPLLVLALGSCGLKYTPQTPPEDKQLQRQRAIESRIRTEFEPQKMTYKSIAFGKTVTVKPASFIKLDSLFEEKYKLEQTGRRNRDLDERIAVQRLVCQNDTNEILYQEEHVFSLSNDSVSEVLSGNFSLNSRNDIRLVEFTQSYTIPADLTVYYSYYVLNESFMFSSANPSQEELDFYDLYRTQAGKLFGAQKEAFVIHTLKLMKIAKTKKSLERQMFLKELSLNALNIKTSQNVVFTRIDQVSTTSDAVDHYVVELTLNESGITSRKYALKFDPYLRLISNQEVL